MGVEPRAQAGDADTKELGVTTVAGLMKAAKRESCVRFRGFRKSSKRRSSRALADPRTLDAVSREEIANDVEALLKKSRTVKGVERAEAAGSYRRKQATVGDIDTLVVTQSPAAVSNAIAKLPFVRNVVAHGDKLSYDLKSGIRVDTRFRRQSQWGSALLYLQGPKKNTTLRVS